MPLEDSVDLSRLSSQINTLRKRISEVATDISVDAKGRIASLKSIENSKYKPLLEQLAYRKSKTELKLLADLLEDLGDLTHSVAELSENLKYYTDAAVYYHYVINIAIEKLGLSEDAELIKMQYKNLSEIRESLYGRVGAKVKEMDLKLEIQSHKNQIEEVRKTSGEKAKVVEEHRLQGLDLKYIKTAKELFDDIASGMSGFLAKLYEEAADEMLIKAPCKYSVIGLGSLALKRITPYSDFDFAILTENDEYKSDPDLRIREYFKDLTHLVHMKMIGLGETIIPTSKYKLNMEHLVNRATNFDLGGKTPLNREYKPYDLVQTVEGMLEYMRNDGNRASSIDKNLHYILETTTFITGSKNLAEQYQTKVSEFMRSINNLLEQNCKTRAQERMKLEITEVDHLNKNKLVQVSHKRKSNEEEFQPFQNKHLDKFIDVKQDIYRFADRYIYNLGQLFCTEQVGILDVINDLQKTGKLGITGAANLAYATTYAQMLRLRTYLHYKMQRDDIEVFVQKPTLENVIPNSNVYQLKANDVNIDGGLFRLYYSFISLHEVMRQILSSDFTEKLLNERFLDECFKYNGLIHYKLRNYEQARGGIEKAINNKEIIKSDEVIYYYNLLACTCYNQGDLTCARNYFSIVKKKMEGRLLDWNGNYPFLLNHLALVNLELMEYPEAQNALKLALEFSESSLDKIVTLYNKASMYYRLNKFPQSINNYLKAKKLVKKLDQAEQKEKLLAIDCGLAKTYKEQENYTVALKYFELCKDMYFAIYKGALNHQLAIIYNMLGEISDQLRNFTQAISYYEDSIKIYETLFGKEGVDELSTPYLGLGNAYLALQSPRYDLAEKYYELCLVIDMKFQKNNSHPDIASARLGLCNVYLAKNNYLKALKMCLESLVNYKIAYGNEDHADIAIASAAVARAYSGLNKYELAKKYYNHSLELHQKLFDSSGKSYCELKMLQIINLFKMHEIDNALAETSSFLHSQISTSIKQNFVSNINMYFSNGNSIVHFFHWNADINALKILSALGEDFNILNANNKTPLDLLSANPIIPEDIKTNIITTFSEKYSKDFLDVDHKPVMSEYWWQSCIPSTKDMLSTIRSVICECWPGVVCGLLTSYGYCLAGDSSMIAGNSGGGEF